MPELLKVAPVLVVGDMPASVEFWREKLGFEVDTYGDGFAMASRGSVTVMLAAAPLGVPPPLPNWRVVDKTNQLYIWVDDADAMYAEVKEKGVPIDFTIYNTPWGTREFGVQDLDEHDIAFGQVLSGS